MRRRLVLGGLGSAPAWGQGGVLRFALSQSWGPPFVERVGDRPVGGILPDLMTALAAELGRTPQFMLLPPARLEAALAEGTVDLQCLLAPGWWPDAPRHLHWSVPVMVLRDVLVSAPAGPASAAAFESGGPWRIGLVRGYRYPALQSQLGSGRFQRDDGLSQAHVLEKLLRGRTEVAVVNEWALKVFNARSGAAPLRELQTVDAVGTHCLFTERGKVGVPQLQEAVRRFVAKGGVAKVLEAYQ